MAPRKRTKYLYLASSLTLLTLSAAVGLNSKRALADSLVSNQDQVAIAKVTPGASGQAQQPTTSSAADGSQSSQAPSSTASQVAEGPATSSAPAQASASQTSGAPADVQSQPAQPTSGAAKSEGASAPVVSQDQSQPVSGFQPLVLAQYSAQAGDGTPYINIGDGNYPRVDAVDISAYQGSMTYDNFVTLRNLGVKTVIIKLTEGNNWQNSYARQQIQYAQWAGLSVQVYHFAHFGTDGVWNEANYLIGMLNSLSLSKGTRIYADMEASDVKYGNVANDLNYFWSLLSNSGYTNHGVYTYLPFDQSYNVSSTVGKQNTWIAQYPYQPSASNLAHQDYGAWQFNSHGRIPGYNGDLDISIDYSGLLRGGYWEKDNGNWYYNDGSSWVTGDQYIGGHWYYFDSNEVMHTGWLNHNNRWYYYNPAGGGQQGQLEYGDQYINGNWYYFDGSGAAVSGWHFANGKYYYYNPDNSGNDYGKLMHGRQLINGKYYLLDNGSGEMLTGLQKSADGSHLNYYREGTNNGDEVQNGTLNLGGQTVHVNNYQVTMDGTGMAVLTTGSNVYVLANRATGELASDGIYTIDGKTYSVQGHQAQAGWRKYNNSWYYFDPTSKEALHHLWFKSDAGNWYYFNDQGQALTGLQTIDGSVYDFDETGAWAKRGWQNINNHWYYFDPTNVWALSNQWFRTDAGNWYYFNAQGQALTGLQTINGHTYDFMTDGAWAMTGWQNINGRWYYFDRTNAWALTNWQRIGGNWYYFNAQGQALTGFQTIDGSIYDFDETGAWANRGWQNINNHWYYFDPTNVWGFANQWFRTDAGNWYYFNDQCQALTGLQTVNGKTYDFMTDGAWAMTGWQSINGRWYYFDRTNAWALTHWQRIDGNWYYFNAQGQALTGLQTIDGSIYDFDQGSAWAKRGWQNINNHWYYFDPTNVWALSNQWFRTDAGNWYYFNAQGQALTGLQTVNGQTYDFANNGAWAMTGWQSINGNWYYFDPVSTGAVTNWQYINGHWYYFDAQGKALTGRQQLSYNGKTAWYWFDPVNAWMYTGAQQIAGGNYMFNPDGSQQLGWQNGHTIYYDPSQQGKQMNKQVN